MNHRTSKITGIGLIFLLMLCTSVTSLGEWSSYQNNDESWGYVGDINGDWSDEYGSYTTYGSGSIYSPLIIDMDNDGVNELISFSGTTIQIFTVVTDSIVLVDDENFGSTIVSQPESYDDFNGDGYPEIVFGTDSPSIVVYGYNGSQYKTIQSNTSIPFKSATGMRCGDYGGDGCWFGDVNGSIIEYGLDSNTFSIFTTTGSFNKSTTKSYTDKPPVIYDFDRDGNTEAVFVYDSNNDGQFGIMVYDITSQSLDTGFSVDGIIDNIENSATQSFIGGVMIYNLNEAGDSEIIVTYAEGDQTQDHGVIATYKSDGTSFWSLSSIDAQNGGGSNYITTPVVRNLNNTDSDFEVCAVVQITSEPRLMCALAIDGTRVTADSSFYLGVGVLNYYTNIITAESLTSSYTDYDKHQIVFNNQIIDITSATTVSTYNLTPTLSTYSKVVGGDVNDDSNIDFCGSYNGGLWCSFSGFVNQPPTFNSSVSLGQNYITPVCVGTTVTFTASENSPYTYSNDLDYDTERLISTCGINSTFEYNGSYSGSSPSLSCTYNNIGNYNFNIYLQDDVNDDDFSQYKTVTLQVINGTSGIECNLPVSSSTLSGSVSTSVSGDDEITSGAEIEYVVDTLTGQEPVIEGIMVIMFTLMIIIALAKYGIKEPLTHAFAIFAVWIVLGFVGLISWIWVVLFALFGIGLGSIFFISRGSGG